MTRILWIRRLTTKRWTTKNEECQEQRVYKQFCTRTSYSIHQPVSHSYHCRTAPAQRRALQNTKIHGIHANPQNPRNSGPLVLWGELVSPPSGGWLPLSQI